MKEVSIIILKKEMKSYNFEVIVVDDNSKDQTSSIAQRYGATVVKNTGPSGQRKCLKSWVQNRKLRYSNNDGCRLLS
jgi:glycosyltransferase involved in cell wall biosynthesis